MLNGYSTCFVARCNEVGFVDRFRKHLPHVGGVNIPQMEKLSIQAQQFWHHHVVINHQREDCAVICAFQRVAVQLAVMSKPGGKI